MLINVSRKVPAMLMSKTRRVAVEALIDLAGHGSQEWMNVAELGLRLDAEVRFLKHALNRHRSIISLMGCAILIMPNSSQGGAPSGETA